MYSNKQTVILLILGVLQIAAMGYAVAVVNGWTRFDLLGWFLR